jgi:predicted ATP-binding protein involved in virulence
MERYSTGYDIRLKQLDLTNYRGFSQLSNLTFDDRVTVLISENGGGKSTILDAIASALKIFVNQLIKSGFTPMPENEKGSIKNGTKNGSIQLQIEGEIFFIDKTEDEHIDDDGITTLLNVETPDSLPLSKLLRITLNEKGVTSRIDGFEANAESEFDFRENFKEHYREEIDHLPILVYYGCNSINTYADTSDDIREGKLFHLYSKSLETNRFSFQSFLRWFDTEYKVSNITNRDASEKSRSLELIQLVAETILNDGTEKVFANLRMQYAIAGDAMVIDKKNSVGGKDTIEISQMSAGEKVMLALAADIAKRLMLANPDLMKVEDGSIFNPLHGRGIVLIDEIDLHLHPKWQRQILPKLMTLFPNVQFVVTTHSPFVVQSVSPQNCIRLINGIPEYFEGNDVGDYETVAIDFFNIHDFFDVETSNQLKQFREMTSGIVDGTRSKKDSDFIETIKNLSQKGDAVKSVIAFELSQMENQLKQNGKDR